MRTIRVYSEEPLAAESTVCLREEAALHVARVLRMRVGDALVLFDGSGRDYAGIIRSIDKKSVAVELAHSNETQTESALKITLWHGICRGGRMDYVVQKATELGVYAVQPLFTARGVVRLDQERAEKRVRHWQKIAVAATEQSGRSVLPQIYEPRPIVDVLADALTDIRNDGTGETNSAVLRLMLDPDGTETFTDLQKTDRLTLLTGPEGGFTDDERAAATDAGFKLVRLGHRVLRSETAPVVALSIAQHMAGDLSSGH
jgi:16S rRNA (uracil1498-N3)-methyltransferase